MRYGKTASRKSGAFERTLGTPKAHCCQHLHLHLTVCGQSLPAPVRRFASMTIRRTRRFQGLDDTVAYPIAVGLDRQFLADRRHMRTAAQYNPDSRAQKQPGPASTPHHAAVPGTTGIARRSARLSAPHSDSGSHWAPPTLQSLPVSGAGLAAAVPGLPSVEGRPAPPPRP